MRLPRLALVISLLLAPGVGWAQTPQPLAPGTRVRYVTSPGAKAVVGTVVAQRGDGLWVRPAKGGKRWRSRPRAWRGSTSAAAP
jgi:hypothetical protein